MTARPTLPIPNELLSRSAARAALALYAALPGVTIHRWSCGSSQPASLAAVRRAARTRHARVINGGTYLVVVPDPRLDTRFVLAL